MAKVLLHNKNCHAAEDSIDHDNDYETITEGDEDNHDDGNYDDVNQMTITTTNKRQLRRMVIIFFFLLLSVHFYNTDPKILKFILHVWQIYESSLYNADVI